MHLFVDIISGDELATSTYKHCKVFGEAGLEVKANYRQKKGDQILIASDDTLDDDEECETVIDIVDAGELNEVALSKKDIMAWAKGFLKTIAEKLKENGKEDRIPQFKKESTEMFKFIIGKIDEFQFYTGKSCNMEGGLAFSYQKEQTDEGPTFLFFADGLKEEKL